MNDDYKDALIEKIHTWTYDALRTSFDEDHTPRDVQEWIDEKVKEKALNELFGVK
jgi:hypothetical protein